MVVDGGVDCGKGLQTSHSTEAKHRAFSSSERLMRVLGAVVQPPPRSQLAYRAEFAERGAVGREPIRHDLFRPTVASHRFPEHLQCSALASSHRNERLQELAFVIDSAPKMAALTIDLHEDLVEVPAPFRVGAHSVAPLPPDLDGEHRAETAPSEPDRFVADVYAAFMEQVLDVSERRWQPEIHHYSKTDDRRAGLKVAERTVAAHAGRAASANLKPQAELL